mmetsp:Transcript_13435/g.36174  ORF Transcript_13435/g.36174 Transcript_13435/m.36174 type:complete len:326 (+) Transcript_13435:80-1057(+)
MPKKPANNKATKLASREGPGSKSDDAILEERRRLEVFAAADTCLGGVAWGTWVLAAIWFLVFSDATSSAEGQLQTLPALSTRCIGDPTVVLIACGVFCSGVARGSQKCAWPSWRKPWHIGWCVTHTLFAVAFARLGFSSSKAPAHRAILSSAKWIALAFALGALVLFATTPRGPPNPSKACIAPFGKLLATVVGLAGVLLTGTFALAADFLEPLGSAAASMKMLPLLMLSCGVGCSTTEGDLVSAAYSVLVLAMGACFKAVAILGEPVEALMPAAIGVTFCFLFLPLPTSDSDSNIFYMALARSARRFHKMLTQPVSGFGDSSED